MKRPNTPCHGVVKQPSRGFTLIELLVVIAIISILASILFPAFARAREGARRASCQSNMRQIGLGIEQYTQDYDERMPNAMVGPSGINGRGGWIYYTQVALSDGTKAKFDPAQGAIYNYVKSTQIFVCPSDTAGQEAGDSYALNSCVAGKSLAAFDDTARFMLLSEEATNSTSTDDGYQLIAVNGFSDRHFSGSDLAFVDSHVKWFRQEKIVSDAYQTGGGSTTACP